MACDVSYGCHSFDDRQFAVSQFLMDQPTEGVLAQLALEQFVERALLDALGQKCEGLARGGDRLFDLRALVGAVEVEGRIAVTAALGHFLDLDMTFDRASAVVPL